MSDNQCRAVMERLQLRLMGNLCHNSHCIPGKPYYVFIDEIQRSRKVPAPGVDMASVAPEDIDDVHVTFYDVLNGWRKLENVDVPSSEMMLTTSSLILRIGWSVCVQGCRKSVWSRGDFWGLQAGLSSRKCDRRKLHVRRREVAGDDSVK